MSLSTAITLALLLKKLTRKGTISRRTFRPTKKQTPTDDETSSFSSEEKLDYGKRASMSEKLQDASHVENCEKKPAVQASSIASIKTVSTIAQPNEDKDDVIIRDFAYPESSPLHHGRPAEERRLSEISLSSSEFTGRQARALYDFTPETEYEIGMKAGEVIWVQYRQCPGWLIADVMDETGLIPESYVEFI